MTPGPDKTGKPRGEVQFPPLLFHRFLRKRSSNKAPTVKLGYLPGSRHVWVGNLANVGCSNETSYPALL